MMIRVAADDGWLPERVQTLRCTRTSSVTKEGHHDRAAYSRAQALHPPR